MSEPIQCPSCRVKLRIPEHMLGKEVKCPKCQSSFTAAAEQPEISESIVAEPTWALGHRASQVQEQDEGESDEETSYEEERPRQRRRRRSQTFQEAEAAVAAPAACLMFLGGLNIVLLILTMVLRIMNVGLLPTGARGPGGPGAKSEMAADNMGGAYVTAFGILLSLGVIVAGIKMKRVENYGLAIAASVFVMLPCCNCCLIGLPLGIWSLVVLNRPEVKVAFP